MAYYERWWISPKGELREVKQENHVTEILANPEAFGTTREAVEQAHERHGERLGIEGKARHEVMVKAMEGGWIRVRDSSPGISMELIDIDRRRDYIQQAMSLLQSRGKVHYNDPVLITDVMSGKQVFIPQAHQTSKMLLESGLPNAFYRFACSSSFSSGNFKISFDNRYRDPFTITVISNQEGRGEALLNQACIPFSTLSVVVERGEQLFPTDQCLLITAPATFVSTELEKDCKKAGLTCETHTIDSENNVNTTAESFISTVSDSLLAKSGLLPSRVYTLSGTPTFQVKISLNEPVLDRSFRSSFRRYAKKGPEIRTRPGSFVASQFTWGACEG